MGVKINIIASGKVMSMAYTIFLSVKKENRYMFKNATFMNHKGWGFTFGNKDDLKISADELTRIEHRVNKLIIKELNIKKKKYYAKLNKGDWHMTSKQMEKYGGGKIIKDLDVFLTEDEKHMIDFINTVNLTS